MIGDLFHDLMRLVVLPAVDFLDNTGFAAFAVIEVHFPQVEEGGFHPALVQFLFDLFQQGMGAFLAGGSVDNEYFAHGYSS